MNRISIIFALLSVGFVFTQASIPDSEAKLWDFIIDVKFLKNPISDEENPILEGTIVDHAYRPVSGINVKITFAGMSYVLTSDENGKFGKQFDSDQLKPRIYSVQVFATSDDGKKSMARTTLEIEGHVGKDAKYERQLESMELANDLSKLRKNSADPISVILYDHYLKLQEKLTNAKHEEELLDLPQKKIREIRENVHNKLIQTLNERPLSTTQFDNSKKYSIFLETLSDEKRYQFELQMNSTKIRFTEAQNMMQDMIKNGTSYETARMAYLEHLSITQEELNLFTLNLEKPENSLKPSTNSTEN